MLLPKRHCVARVRAGKKRQAIRPWSRLLVRPGQICYAPALGRLLIAAPDELPSLDALTEAGIHDDDIASRDRLFAAIDHIYLPPTLAAPKRYPPGAKRRRRLPVRLHQPNSTLPAKAKPASPSNKTRQKTPPPRPSAPKPTRRAIEQLIHPMHGTRPRHNPGNASFADRDALRDIFSRHAHHA